eukprot:1359712-Ditylum_brightwellii.AAC.1
MFVEEFLRANKGKRRKLIAELTIRGMGGQICDDLRDEWNCFSNRDDFVQTGREAAEANDLAVSSPQSEGEKSSKNNGKANKLEPGAGIF